MHTAESQLLLHDSPVTTELRRLLALNGIHYYMFLKRLLLMFLREKLVNFTFEWLCDFDNQTDVVF